MYAVDAPFDVDPASVTSVRHVFLADAYAMAIESRPEIRSARLRVRKSELERHIRSAERVPDVSFSLTGFKTANFSSVLPNNISSVGVQVTWDVFDWGRKRQEIEAGRDTELQATYRELDDFTDRIEKEIKLAPRGSAGHARRRARGADRGTVLTGSDRRARHRACFHFRVLQSPNTTLPAGTLNAGGRDLALEQTGEFRTLADLDTPFERVSTSIRIARA